MPRCRSPTPRLFFHLRQMLILTLTRRFILLIACVTFLSLIWIQFDSSAQQPIAENLIEEAIENAKKDARYSEVYRKSSRLPKDIKYILLWTDKTYAPFYFFGEGQRTFIEKKCPVINCYVTSDRNFLEDTTKFDAIAFNGRNLDFNLELPKRRSAHQKYIYVNMESADNYPVCDQRFDGFFNWTATYRLDSDVPYPYIMVKKHGKVIGPKKDMVWPEFPEVSQEIAEKLSNKSKAAAWFVSSCFSRSKRADLAERLAKALGAYKHKVDVYGLCGWFKCPRTKKDTCDSLLERDYYFYLSLENSFDEDYVTEKVLTALQHDVVPIVYGGADYSRFLPPNSYIDARNYSAIDLAAFLHRIINTPRLYMDFFRWKGHLTFTDPSKTTNVCDLCAALNSGKAADFSIYENFRKWWHPYYLTRCSEKHV